MKQIGVLLSEALLLAIVALGIGCAEPEPIIVDGIYLSTHSLGFTAEGGSRTIEVSPYTEHTSWSVEGDNAEWYTISTNEHRIEITVEANTATESRSAELRVYSPAGSFDAYTVTISQEACEKLQLSTNAPETCTFDSAGGDYTFSIESNYEWEATTEAAWLTIEQQREHKRLTISAERNDGAERNAKVTITAGEGAQRTNIDIAIAQGTHADNPYYQLVGKWEITASKWFYSPNGSLNSLDYAPNPSDYCLIFDIEEGEYGKTLYMRDFLYPGTSLEVRYDAQSGGFIIPFGWTVLSYDVFFYITMVGTSQFSYASLEVEVEPNSDHTILQPKLPSVDGFNYVGFGLWTYDENGAKIALGSNYRPTMFPMGDIKFHKHN